MKTIILCGGRGTRLNDLGTAVPKGLLRIGENPIIWHICKSYAQFGLNEFVLCLGFLSNAFEDYFGQPVAASLGQSPGPIASSEGWQVNLIDTGADTNTGGRIKRIEPVLDEPVFCVTYGDGLANIDLQKLLEFHRRHGKIATLTAVNPISSFGMLDLDGKGAVTSFREKPLLNEWVNGGFFVFNRSVFEYLDEGSILEREPFEQLAAAGELMAYRHDGFWKCMDTFKDNIELNELWSTGAPWKTW